MYALTKLLRTAPQALCLQPRLTFLSPAFARLLATKPSAEGDGRPLEGHVLDRKHQPKNTLDPQAQSAQGSTQAPRDETPAYVHGRVNRGDGTGGAEKKGTGQDAAAPSWWASLKQKVGLGASTSETKHGSQSGNK